MYNIFTSVSGDDRKFVHISRLIVQRCGNADFTTSGTNLELPKLSESIAKGVIDHSINSTIGIGSRDLHIRETYIIKRSVN